MYGKRQLSDYVKVTRYNKSPKLPLNILIHGLLRHYRLREVNSNGEKEGDQHIVKESDLAGMSKRN